MLIRVMLMFLKERDPLAGDKFEGFTIFFLGSSFQARCVSQDSLEK